MFDETQYALLVKPLRQVYGADLDGTYINITDYNPLIESMGFTVMLKVDDDDYQGDSRVLLRHGDFWGILIFGWGSCSGCDRLQGCSSEEEIEELRKDLFNSIKWGTAAETLAYVREHDWEGDFCWHAEETREFVRQAEEMLAAVAAAHG